ESNIIPGYMIEDELVRFDETDFECVDKGFRPNEPVDVVIRPEDIELVPYDQGKLKGTVESVLFKGMLNEVIVETVPGTNVTVQMHVTEESANQKDDGHTHISANSFYLDLEDMEGIEEKELIARADAQAWDDESDEQLSIEKVETDLEKKLGAYPITFTTRDGLSITKTIQVIDQNVVKNPKKNEGVSAFDFFKSKNEIKESTALDTDLKIWANAQGWRLDDEDKAVNLTVTYDFDPNNIELGVYPVTFWTTGREFKVHTTAMVKEGTEVGLDFKPEDIHVMEKEDFIS
ncbi:MAG: TOBE domain-containing protein, partial [Allobaculum sp.]|nr:TOBE domain-containing protein [Allobaculum sp.]